MTERLHFHFSLSCIGEGNGNPLQCSCLENPRDRGAWRAAVCGVAQSRTRLKRLSSSSSRSVHGIPQARILQWVAISFSRGSSWPRDWTWVSHIVGRLFTDWVTREDYPCLRYIISAWSPVEEFGFLFWIQRFYSMDLEWFSKNSPIHNFWLNHMQLLAFFWGKKKKNSAVSLLSYILCSLSGMPISSSST